jgi:hypothetical protein
MGYGKSRDTSGSSDQPQHSYEEASLRRGSSANRRGINDFAIWKFQVNDQQKNEVFHELDKTLQICEDLDSASTKLKEHFLPITELPKIDVQINNLQQIHEQIKNQVEELYHLDENNQNITKESFKKFAMVKSLKGNSRVRDYIIEKSLYDGSLLKIAEVIGDDMKKLSDKIYNSIKEKVEITVLYHSLFKWVDTRKAESAFSEIRKSSHYEDFRQTSLELGKLFNEMKRDKSTPNESIQETVSQRDQLLKKVADAHRKFFDL